MEVASQGDGGTGEDGAGAGVPDADVDADFVQFRQGDVAEFRGAEAEVGEAEEGIVVVEVDGVDEPGGGGGVEDLEDGGLGAGLVGSVGAELGEEFLGHEDIGWVGGGSCGHGAVSSPFRVRWPGRSGLGRGGSASLGVTPVCCALRGRGDGPGG